MRVMKLTILASSLLLSGCAAFASAQVCNDLVCQGKGPHFACDLGFMLNPDKTTCRDIDECACMKNGPDDDNCKALLQQGHDPLPTCDPDSTKCVNTCPSIKNPTGYKCQCKPGMERVSPTLCAPPPVDCKGKWRNITECKGKCDCGLIKSEFVVIEAAKYGGEPCMFHGEIVNHGDTRMDPCSLPECPPKPTVTRSDCSKRCGPNATLTATYTYPTSDSLVRDRVEIPTSVQEQCTEVYKSCEQPLIRQMNLDHCTFPVKTFEYPTRFNTMEGASYCVDLKSHDLGILQPDSVYSRLHECSLMCNHNQACNAFKISEQNSLCCLFETTNTALNVPNDTSSTPPANTTSDYSSNSCFQVVRSDSKPAIQAKPQPQPQPHSPVQTRVVESSIISSIISCIV
eukprot:166612-Amorphochlora_amoeboformis.AAC.1